MDEFDLIGRLFTPLSAGEPGALGLMDDAACLSLDPGLDLVATKDALVEGVHFFADDPPQVAASRLLRTNLSDLAAKGARPRFYLLAMALPPHLDEAWITAFAAALAEEQRRWGGALVGGDTVSTTGAAVLSLTALGTVAHGDMIPRKGARAGDLVCVSGTIGDAALYVRRRLAGQGRDTALEERFRRPEPRLRLGAAFRAAGIRAAADVSDGLAADLGHVCTASGLGAVIRACDVPVSPAVRGYLAADPGLMETVLTGGDDYEIVFAADPGCDLAALARAGGVGVTPIGRFVEGGGVVAEGPDGRPMRFARSGWTHPIGIG